MPLAISGTYMTFLQSGSNWGPGPFIVVGDDASVTVDGVAIKNPAIGANVTWNASAGNPSSADIAFATTATGKSCYGKYTDGSGPLPSGNNLAGTAQPPPQSLASWNGTYNTFNKNGSKWDKDSTMVVNAPIVTYKNKQIANAIYTGVAGTGGNPDVDQLAWFMASGNDDNVIISFAMSKSDKVFGGTKWNSGSEPSEPNFTGTTASTPEPPTITVQVALVLALAVSAQAEAVEAEVTEVEVTEVEVTEVEVVEVEVVEVVVLAEEEKEKKAQAKPRGANPKADAAAAADLTAKAFYLATGRTPE